MLETVTVVRWVAVTLTSLSDAVTVTVAGLEVDVLVAGSVSAGAESIELEGPPTSTTWYVVAGRGLGSAVAPSMKNAVARTVDIEKRILSTSPGKVFCCVLFACTCRLFSVSMSGSGGCYGVGSGCQVKEDCELTAQDVQDYVQGHLLAKNL